MSYTYFVSEDSITLINTSNGNQVTIFKDDQRFTEFKDSIMMSAFAYAESLDTATVITKFSKSYGFPQEFSVDIIDGVGSITINGHKYPLMNAIIDRMIKMEKEGFSAYPLFNFLKNLYGNPSSTAIDELYMFLEQTGLPITNDGYFIAYKIVREDYMDIYSKSIDNSIGKIIEMPRFAVDDKRHNTCSNGLHFCSKSYLEHYGSSNRSSDRCVLVKINPADVVSIPSDYNNAKGRTCKYEVVGEMNEKDWREILSKRDYTESPVVNNSGLDDDDDLEYFDDDDLDVGPTIVSNYFFNKSTKRWHSAETQKMVSRKEVLDNSGYSLPQILELEQK